MAANPQYDQPLHRVEEKYFAAVNSREGFIGYFGEIFRDLSRLYIIKGGPGTGKSRLMREVALEAEKRGYRVEYYYCSADDTSLDGIMIRGMEVGILDGTFPHTRDPEMAGALEEILYMGAFWNSEKLCDKLHEIRRLNERKKQFYASVYDLLAAAGHVEFAVRAIGNQALNSEKMTAAAERLLRGTKGKGEGREELRILSCIGMNGEVRFHTFEQMAKHRVLIRNKAECGYLFLKELRKIAMKNGLHTTVSFSPLHPDLEDALYIRETETVYMLEEHADSIDENDRLINMTRFIDVGKLSEHKAKLRFLHRLSVELKKGAIHSLSEIKKTHFALEEIYSSTMNFEAKEAFTADLIARIFH